MVANIFSNLALLSPNYFVAGTDLQECFHHFREKYVHVPNISNNLKFKVTFTYLRKYVLHVKSTENCKEISLLLYITFTTDINVLDIRTNEN